MGFSFDDLLVNGAEIGGDKGRTENDLPYYLQDEDLPDPVIPMDAMPTPGTP